MNPLSRNALVGYLAATFTAGVVAGGFAAWSAAPKAPQRPPRDNTPMSKRMLETFTRELGLATNQVERFRPIMEDTDREMSEIHRESGRRMKEAFERCNSRMLPVLDDSQKEKLTAFQKKMEKRFSERRRPPGPPPEAGAPDHGHGASPPPGPSPQ
jgi:Spy/CpxP family protein refolding chaperone